MKTVKKEIALFLVITMVISLFVGFGGGSDKKVKAEGNLIISRMLFVAMSGSGNIEAYNSDTGSFIKTIATGLPNPNELVYDKTGYLYVTCGSGATGYIYKVDVSTGAKTLVYTQSAGRLTGIDMYNGIMYASVADIGYIDIIDMSNFSKSGQLTTEALTMQIKIHNGKLYAAQYDAPSGLFFVYDLTTKLRIEAVGPTIKASGIAFDGDTLVTSFHGHASLFNYNGTSFDYYIAPGQGVDDSTFYIEIAEKIYTSGYLANSVKIFNKTTRTLETTITQNVSNPSGFAIANIDIMAVAMSGSGNIEAYDAYSGNFIKTIASGLPNPNELIYDGSGYLYVTCGSGATGYIYKVDVSTGAKTLVYTQSAGRLTGIDMYNGIMYAAVADIGYIDIIDMSNFSKSGQLATEALTMQIKIHNGKLYAAQYDAPSGLFFVYDLTTKLRIEAVGPTIKASGIAFDGDTLVTSFHGHTSLFNYNGTSFPYYIAPGQGIDDSTFYIEIAEKIYTSGYLANSVKIFNKTTRTLETTITKNVSNPSGIEIINGVTGISLDKSSNSVNAGASFNLTATIMPNNASNKNVTWSSSNESIATVNSSGLVSGVSGGSATITATTADGVFVTSCNVTVTEVPVTFGTYKVSTGKYISNVDKNATVATFIAGLSLGTGSVVLKDKNGTPMSSGFVTTGTKLDVTNGALTDTYKIVIFGDVDEIAGIDVGDLAAVKLHLLKQQYLIGDYLVAGDTSGKGSVTISDLLAVKKSILGISIINQDRLA